METNGFIKKVAKRVCDINSCDQCKDRINACKHPHLKYNHYSYQIAWLLLDNLTIDEKTDIDTVLSIIHTKKKLNQDTIIKAIEFIDTLSDTVLPVIVQHFECINDERLCYMHKNEDGDTFVYYQKESPELMGFREWIKMEYPEYFLESN